ncbi:hypothetical protein BDW68DRAFT_8625 [Aspergillus falconensis]
MEPRDGVMMKWHRPGRSLDRPSSSPASKFQPPASSLSLSRNRVSSLSLGWFGQPSTPLHNCPLPILPCRSFKVLLFRGFVFSTVVVCGGAAPARCSPPLPSSRFFFLFLLFRFSAPQSSSASSALIPFIHRLAEPQPAARSPERAIVPLSKLC